jgi:hypothetical protein
MQGLRGRVAAGLYRRPRGSFPPVLPHTSMHTLQRTFAALIRSYLPQAHAPLCLACVLALMFVLTVWASLYKRKYEAYTPHFSEQCTCVVADDEPLTGGPHLLCDGWHLPAMLCFERQHKPRTLPVAFADG